MRNTLVRKAGAVAVAVALATLTFGATAWAALPGTLPGNPDPANIDDSEQYLFVVYPTGMWSLTAGDVANVQWAVDTVASGGMVLLKATNTAGQPAAFNFGTVTFSYVTVGRSLTLLGEALARDPRGGWVTLGTTIRGGTQMQWGTMGVTPAPSVVAKDIIFDGFSAGAIRINTSRGYNEISGCAFTNFLKGPVVGGAVTGAFPIIVHGGVELADIENLGGTLKVLNNFFGRPVNPDGSPANLINNLMHFSNCHLDLEISGNTIEDCNWDGFAVTGNKGRTVISKNVINKTRSFFYEGAAISVGVYLANSLFVSRHTYDGPSEVTDNVITVGAPEDAQSTTNSYGIVIARYPATQTFPGFPDVVPMPVPEGIVHVVSGNAIRMYRNSVSGSLNRAAIACLGDASATTWIDNTVEGEAARGIQVSRALPDFMIPANTDAYVKGNAFRANDLGGFSAGEYQVYLDAYSEKNELKNNDYGPAGGAGTYVQGNNNGFENENFWGDYPGTMDLDGDPLNPAVPCMWFASGAVGNVVSAFKNGQALQGFDLCTKIYFEEQPALNTVHGYEKCIVVPKHVILAMTQKELELRQQDCESSRGEWIADGCACPPGVSLNSAADRCGPLVTPEVMEAMGYSWNESSHQWE